MCGRETEESPEYACVCGAKYYSRRAASACCGIPGLAENGISGSEDR